MNIILQPHSTGKERDTESGNDYFSARYYASKVGRFLSPDRLGAPAAILVNPQTWNLYSYVINNPLSFIDPTGFVQCQVDNGSPSDTDKGARAECIDMSYLIYVIWGFAASDSIAVQGASGSGPQGVIPLVNAKAPNTGSIKPMSRLACASYRADKELSIASMTSGSSPDNPAVQAFLGNSISGAVNLFTTNENPLTNLVTGGWNPGVPGVPAPEVGGYALDGGFTGVATKAVLGGATDLFALPKLAYDAATFLGAAAFLCR